MRRSMGTISSEWISRIASSARCFDGPSAATAAPVPASIEPRIRSTPSAHQDHSGVAGRTDSGTVLYERSRIAATVRRRHRSSRLHGLRLAPAMRQRRFSRRSRPESGEADLDVRRVIAGDRRLHRFGRRGIRYLSERDRVYSAAGSGRHPEFSLPLRPTSQAIAVHADHENHPSGCPNAGGPIPGPCRRTPIRPRSATWRTVEPSIPITERPSPWYAKVAPCGTTACSRGRCGRQAKRSPWRHRSAGWWSLRMT